MANYLSHLRRASTGKRGGGAAFTSAAGAAPNERSRLAAAQATAQEMKNQVAAGKLVDAAAVESTWVTIVTMTRDAVLATPSWISAELPHLTQYDLSIVDKHLREALQRLASEPAP